MKRICIVTPGQPSTNSRVVKEADALYEAGYDVTVVFCPGWAEWAMRHDELLLAKRKWKYKAILWSRNNPRLFHKSRVRYFVVRKLRRCGFPFFPPEYALGRIYPELLGAVLNEKADLYIAHYLAALPAAVKAAQIHGGIAGFDAEDFHSGERAGVSMTAGDRAEVRLAEYTEQKYLPKCRYMTTTSEPIAEAYAKKYGIRKPQVVLNTFPLSMRGSPPRPAPGKKGELSLYWFSQTVGPGRGIEDALQAMKGLSKNIRLYLQGAVRKEYKKRLCELASGLGLHEDQIRFMDCAYSEDLVKIASAFDAGLTLEQPATVNRDLALTNKLFVYVLAGLSVIATETKGQAPIIRDLGRGGWLYKPGDIRSLAGRLEQLATDRPELDASKQASYRRATERYNWESEREKLLAAVREALS